MSDILLIKNISGQWISHTVLDHISREEALRCVKTYPEYKSELGDIIGVTGDDFWPLDDSNEYIGWDNESESLLIVTSNPDCYCKEHTLKLLYRDGSTEIIRDTEGNEIHGLLEEDK